LEKKRRKKV